MKLFVSVLFNREDSDIIGIYHNLRTAVEQTFKYMIEEEYLDYHEPQENADKESLSDEQFLKLLKEETENWELSKLDTVCKKYNSGYDDTNMFIMIK